MPSPDFDERIAEAYQVDDDVQGYLLDLLEELLQHHVD